MRLARRLFRVKAPTLEERFVAFCKAYPDSEAIRSECRRRGSEEPVGTRE
jgi:hypothetical protein